MSGTNEARYVAFAALPAQRRSESSMTRHRIVAARASAVVLDREGLHEQAEQLRTQADLMERGEFSG